MKLRNLLIFGCLTLAGSQLSAMTVVMPTENADLLAKDLERIDEGQMLFWAASQGKLDTVKSLVEHSKAPVDWATKSGCTALHAAAKNNQYKVVEYFIKNGASVNAQAADGTTALHIVALNGHPFVLHELLKAPDAEMLPDNQGRKPLHLAVLEHGVGFFSPLVSRSDVNEKADGGLTPLHFAAAHGNYKAVKDLLGDFMCNGDIDVVTDEGESVAEYAQKHGHENIARFIHVYKKFEKQKDSPHYKVLMKSLLGLQYCNISTRDVNKKLIDISDEPFSLAVQATENHFNGKVTVQLFGLDIAL